MAQPIRSKAIRDAIVRAAEQLVLDEGTQKGAAMAAGVTQQTISTAINEKRVGFDLLLGLSGAFGSTIDHLIGRFGGYQDGEVGVIVGSLPGWTDAVLAAREQMPGVTDLTWALAASIHLPVRPQRVGVLLAMKCAELVTVCGEGSGERPRSSAPPVRKAR
jgi:transcriptional regulator with XRE-family HTH domain